MEKLQTTKETTSNTFLIMRKIWLCELLENTNPEKKIIGARIVCTIRKSLQSTNDSRKLFIAKHLFSEHVWLLKLFVKKIVKLFSFFHFLIFQVYWVRMFIEDSISIQVWWTWLRRFSDCDEEIANLTDRCERRELITWVAVVFVSTLVVRLTDKRVSELCVEWECFLSRNLKIQEFPPITVIVQSS